MGNVKNFMDFITQFLVKRELEEPDGRPLFEYKITNGRYDLLKTLLNDQWEDSQACYACFSLYASEYWRRNYDGGPWSWLPIFELINKKNIYNPNNIGIIIQNGLRFWQREIIIGNNGQREFLGSIVLECGIPIKMLQSDNNYIKNVIIKLFSKVDGYNFDNRKILHLANLTFEECRVPKTLKNFEFIRLIIGFVETIVELKIKYNLTNQQSPINLLNQKSPEWKNYFPIRMDETGEKFIDEVISGVVEEIKKERLKILITHYLIKSNNLYKIKSKLLIPSGFHSYESFNFTGGKILASKLHLKIISNGEEEFLGFAFNSKGKIFCNEISKTLSLKTVSSNWQLIVESEDGSIYQEIDISEKNILEEMMPWTFISRNGRWEFFGAGSLKTNAAEAILILPTDYELNSTGKENVNICLPDKKAYKITSTSIVTYEDFIFSINLGVENLKSLVKIISQNNRTIGYFPRLNQNIYLGFPRFQFIENGRNSFPVVEYKKVNSTEWLKPNGQEIIGRIRIRCLGKKGEVLYFTTVNILPSDFEIKYERGGGNTRNIKLMNLQDENVLVRDNPDYNCDISKNGPDFTITLDSKPKTDKVELLLCPNHGGEIRLFLPFPAKEEAFVDKTGHLLRNGDSAYINNLYGYRIVFNNFNPGDKRRTLYFTLSSRFNTNDRNVSISKKIVVSNRGKEISLNEYKNILQNLFSFTDSIGDYVSISTGRGDISLKIFQSNENLTHNKDHGIITLDTSPALRENVPRLIIFNLLNPLNADSIKIIDYDQNDHRWLIPNEVNLYEKWLVFSEENPMVINPILIGDLTTIKDGDEIDFLHQSSLFSFKNRQISCVSHFNKISTEFDHSDWKELKEIFGLTKHYSLHIFDYWKALVRSNKGLIAALLKFNKAIITKISDEFAVNWYVISVEDWISVFKAYKKYLEAKYEYEDIIQLLESKIDFISAEFTLNSIGEVLKHELGLSDEIKNINTDIFNYSFKPMHKTFIQRNIDAKWPINSAVIISKFNNLPKDLRLLIPEIQQGSGYMKPAIYLPFLLAYQTINPAFLDLRNPSNQLRFEVYQLIYFDEAYFQEAFNLSLAYCYSQSI
jgi:hypothetical protein